MAKLIFTSRYIRDAPPEHLQNYVRYISTGGVRARLERMKKLRKERDSLYEKQNDLKVQKCEIEKSLER